MRINVLYALLGILLVILVINVSISTNLFTKVNEKIKVAKEQNSPAEITVIKIAAPNCESCFDVEPFISQLKNQNVNVTSERTLLAGSSEAQQLTSKYSIDKLPAVIVTGEINKTDTLKNFFLSKGELKDGEKTFVFTKQEVPYYSLSGNRIVGAVKVITLEPSDCSACVDFTPFLTALKQNNVKIVSEEKTDYKSLQAQGLIKEYGVQAIPAILVSKEIDDYENLRNSWRQLNVTLKGDYYALHATLPPYIDLSTNKTVGLVGVIYLKDSSCTICYDVKLHKRILANFGIVPYEEVEIEINSEEGQELLSKYNITNVPTILLSPETSAYTQLDKSWSQVGTKANDSWYIFRDLSIAGLLPYKDLTTNTVVEQ